MLAHKFREIACGGAETRGKNRFLKVPKGFSPLEFYYFLFSASGCASSSQYFPHPAAHSVIYTLLHVFYGMFSWILRGAGVPCKDL